MTALVYSNVTQQQVDDLSKKLAEGGAAVKSTGNNQWTVTGHGVTSLVTYDTTTSGLKVEVQKKPFFVTESMIDHGIRAALGRA